MKQKITESEIIKVAEKRLKDFKEGKVKPVGEKEFRKYLKKLEKIEKEDRRIHFKNIKEFDKHFGI